MRVMSHQLGQLSAGLQARRLFLNYMPLLAWMRRILQFEQLPPEGSPCWCQLRFRVLGRSRVVGARMGAEFTIGVVL
jgi:hypothetical protein